LTLQIKLAYYTHLRDEKQKSASAQVLITFTSDVGQMTAARFIDGFPPTPCVSIVHSKHTLWKVLPNPVKDTERVIFRFPAWFQYQSVRNPHTHTHTRVRPPALLSEQCKHERCVCVLARVENRSKNKETKGGVPMSSARIHPLPLKNSSRCHSKLSVAAQKSRREGGREGGREAAGGGWLKTNEPFPMAPGATL
jgi:hypothetical protein